MNAPIILFVYNRPEHTLRTLRALQCNEGASGCTLYIFADGAKTGANAEQMQRVEEVRRICRSEKWCGTVIMEEAEKNKGLAASVIYGVTKIIDKHKRAIILEDDIVTTPHFIRFMNEGLNNYEQETRVAGITGFSYDDSPGLDDYFFLPIASSWGWAVWKRSWDYFTPDARQLYDEIVHQQLQTGFDFGTYPYLRMLKAQADGLIDSWGIRFYASVFLRKQLFLFPRHTFLENIGFDNSGTHCDDTNAYSSVKNAGSYQPIGLLKPEVKSKNYDIIWNTIKTNRLKAERQAARQNPKSSLQFLKNRIPGAIKNTLKKVIRKK